MSAEKAMTLKKEMGDKMFARGGVGSVVGDYFEGALGVLGGLAPLAPGDQHLGLEELDQGP